MEKVELVNAVGWVMGVLPSIGVMGLVYMYRGEPWRIGNLITSLILIGLAVMMVGLLADMLAAAELLNSKNKLDNGIFAQMKASGGLWLALFPAVVGGVGVNVLSNFLTSKKP